MNIHETILEFGHDEDFRAEPVKSGDASRPGSRQRVAIYAARVREGREIFSGLDANNQPCVHGSERREGL